MQSVLNTAARLVFSRGTTASRHSWHSCTGWRCRSASSLSLLFWYTNAYTEQLRRTLLRNFTSHLLMRLVSVSALLRHSSLIVSRTRLSTIGDRAFPVAAARLWYTLPLDVTSISVFRKHLKTHLFSYSFPACAGHCYLLTYLLLKCVVTEASSVIFK